MSYSIYSFIFGGVAQSMIFIKAFQSNKIIQLKTAHNTVVGVLAKQPTTK
jgi:hypothetical protein